MPPASRSGAQRHGPLGDRQKTVAGAVQHRECGDRTGTYNRKDYRRDWMQQGGRSDMRRMAFAESPGE
jgi:hypothetical protein